MPRFAVLSRGNGLYGQCRAVLRQRHAGRYEPATKRKRTECDLESRRGARRRDQIGLRAGVAELLIDLQQGCFRVRRDHVLDHRGDPGSVTNSNGHQKPVALFRRKLHEPTSGWYEPSEKIRAIWFSVCPVSDKTGGLVS